MKRFLCVILTCVFVFGCVSALGEQDYSQYTLLDLYNARREINNELVKRETGGNVIFEDKEVEITWLGFDEKSFPGYLKTSLLIKNKTKKSLYYSISNLAFNNIQAAMTNSISSMEISPEMSYLTATNNLYIVDLSGYAPVGINSSSDIDDVYIEISFFKSDDWNAKATKVVKETVHLPIN